jgi:hypothetical protein
MSKQTVKGFMFMEFDWDWTDGEFQSAWRPRWKEWKADENDKRVYVGEMPIEFDVPDDFDPIPRQVAALQQEKAEALAEYQRKVADINERLSKVQALTFEASA